MLNVPDILQQLKASKVKLPKPLRILVKVRESGGKRRSTECTAMCMQYPIHASGASELEAVVALLNNLSNYLIFCADQPDCHPVVYAPQLYLEAFDFGSESDDLDVQEIKENLDLTVHVSKELKQFLKKQVVIRMAPQELEPVLIGA
jgi:hypothetical protein